MAKTVLLVGTRKGLFVLESDGDRSKWAARGPLCEGWPIYHAILDQRLRHDLRGRCKRVARLGRLAEHRSRRDVGALERGSLVPRGRREALQDLGPDGRARAPVRRRRGARHLRIDRRRCDVVAPQHARGPARQRGLERSRRTSRPGHLGIPAILPASRRRRRTTGRSCRAWASSRRPTTPCRGRRGTRASAPTGRSRIPRSATACTSS